MLCENCKEREATVHFTEIMNGRVQKHHLCKECAAQMEMMGYASNEVPFVKLLTGMLAAGQTQEQGENPLQYVRCPKCGMTYEEFTRVGKFGCAECIDVFGPLIGDHMKKLHGVIPIPARLTQKKKGSLKQNRSRNSGYRSFEAPVKRSRHAGKF